MRGGLRSAGGGLALAARRGELLEGFGVFALVLSEECNADLACHHVGHRARARRRAVRQSARRGRRRGRWRRALRARLALVAAPTTQRRQHQSSNEPRRTLDGHREHPRTGAMPTPQVAQKLGLLESERRLWPGSWAIC